MVAEAITKPARSKRGPLARVCPTCQVTFITPDLGPKKTHVYCSRKCAEIVQMTERNVARTMTESETTWLAGVVDGEGSIIWASGEGKRPVRLNVYNTNVEFLKRSQEIAGTGTINATTAGRYSPKHKQGWTWQCYGSSAAYLIAQMYPWLIVKREKAERVLEVYRDFLANHAFTINLQFRDQSGS